MPFTHALIKNCRTVRQDETVEKAMGILKDEACGIVPVLDSNDRVVGVFSRRRLLQEILPVSVSVPIAGSENENLELPPSVNAMLNAAPGLSRRLQKLRSEQMSALTGMPFISVTLDTPLWESIARLAEAGEGLPVIDEDGMLKGVVTEASLLDALETVV